MTDVTPGIEQRPWLPPRWFIRLAWIAHRLVYRVTGGRRGLSVPRPGATFGHMRLRRSWPQTVGSIRPPRLAWSAQSAPRAGGRLDRDCPCHSRATCGRARDRAALPRGSFLWAQFVTL